MSDKKCKALELLSKGVSTKDRASKYVERVSKSIELSLINKMEEDINKMEDEVFELKNFDLETDVNSGKKEMTKEEVEKRFLRIIQIEVDMKLRRMELEATKEAYNNLFK